MLKNLEKRYRDKAQKPIDQSMLLGLQAAPDKKRSWLRPVAICLMVLVLITTIYLSIGLVGSLKKKHLLDFIFTPAGNLKVENLVPAPLKSNATLQNIFITRAASEIVIQFTFDMMVSYQLRENTDHSESTIILNNVNYGANPPILPVGFVKALNTKVVGKDLQITMETIPGTEIKVMQDQTQKPARLIFILTNNLQTVVLAKPEMKKTLVPPTSEEIALTDYQDALDFIAHGHLEQAVSLLTKVVQADPKLVAARKTLVALLIKSDQIDSATRYVESGLKITPDAIDLIELDAKLLLIKNNPQAALRVLQKVSPQLMQEPEYYALLASVEQQLGFAPSAEQIYKQLLSFDRSNANWWVGLGLALESQKKNNSALQAYKKAFSLGGLSSGLKMSVQGKIAGLTR